MPGEFFEIKTQNCIPFLFSSYWLQYQPSSNPIFPRKVPLSILRENLSWYSPPTCIKSSGPGNHFGKLLPEERRFPNDDRRITQMKMFLLPFLFPCLSVPQLSNLFQVLYTCAADQAKKQARAKPNKLLLPETAGRKTCLTNNKF